MSAFETILAARLQITPCVSVVIVFKRCFNAVPFLIRVWVLVSVIAVFWATIPNPTRPRVADSGTPYRYIG